MRKVEYHRKWPNATNTSRNKPLQHLRDLHRPPPLVLPQHLRGLHRPTLPVLPQHLRDLHRPTLRVLCLR
ncbi:diagnostic antigen gp50 [Echinococcus multilocularis]|uniref:Diagnostic antigen gp50 n=1 Tax=Echinococcus multilocularis TaxID=6211 RepID=A0A068XX91_ECHMU|nr:diagnostic antigen gp50 [Echinococcus multilocularis]